MNPPPIHAPVADASMTAVLLGAAVLISRWETNSLRAAVNTAAHGRPDGAPDHDPTLRTLLAHLGIQDDDAAPGDLLDRWQQTTNPTNDSLIHTLIAASRTAQAADKAVAR